MEDKRSDRVHPSSRRWSASARAFLTPRLARSFLLAAVLLVACVPALVVARSSEPMPAATSSIPAPPVPGTLADAGAAEAQAGSTHGARSGFGALTRVVVAAAAPAPSGSSADSSMATVAEGSTTTADAAAAGSPPVDSRVGAVGTSLPKKPAPAAPEESEDPHDVSRDPGDAEASSARSPRLRPSVPPAVPGMPTGLVVASDDMRDSLTWSAPATGKPPARYVIAEAANPTGPFADVAQTTATACSIEVTGTALRYYTVRSVAGSRQSSACAPVSNARVAMSAAVGPQGRTLRASNGDVELAIPPGAYSATTTVSVVENESAQMPPSLIRLAGVFGIEPSGALGSPATLRVRYEVGVEHFQVADKLLAAAELMTYEAGTGSWVKGANDAHVSGSWLEGTVAHFSYWSGATIQPHGTTPAKTSYCSGICHNLVAAPGSPIVIPNRDPVVCFNCHGNALSTDPPAGATGPNIEAALHECDDQSFDPASESRHPIALNDLACTDCHDIHRDPASSANLLRVYDAVTGRAVRGGSAFCWACHGTKENARVASLVPGYWARSGGDKKTTLSGTPHASVPTTAIAGACGECHTGHGSASTGLVKTTIAGEPVSGNDNSACFACHDGATRTYPGKAVYEVSVHGPPGGVQQGKCNFCHDPHGKPGVPDYLDAAEENACYSCHDGNENPPCNNCHKAAFGMANPNIKSPMNKTLPRSITWQRNDVWSNATDGPAVRVKVGDIDADGDEDFASVWWADQTIRWHENTAGDGSAWATASIGAAPVATMIRSLDVGDLEGDGDLDVLMSCMQTSGSPVTGYVKVFVNTAGDGSVWAERNVRQQTAARFDGYTSAAFGDFDDDGDLDVASNWWTRDTRWHQNTAGDGTAWGDTVVYTSAFYVGYQVAVGDMTGDGAPDIVSGNEAGQVQVHQNVGLGTSWALASSNGLSAGEIHDIEIGDVDGDNDNDVLATGWADAIRLAKNTAGNGTTWSNSQLPNYWSLDNVNIALADLDGDLDLDVLASIAMPADTDRAIYQYLNTSGDGSGWSGAYAFLGGPSDYVTYVDIDAADFDQDGDQDLCFGGRLTGTGRKAFWLENLGMGPIVSGAHPTNSVAGRHSADEAVGDVGAGNRHAECADCHNAHKTRGSVHAMGTNLASEVIQGVPGVGVANSAPDAPPTFTETSAIAYEYELCFRCHSSYTTGFTGEDKATAFNTLNAAFHPVEDVAPNLGVKDSAFTLGTPWNPTAGDDADYSVTSPKMTCSDCHNNNNQTYAKGPHGSTHPHILRARASTNANELGGGQNALCVVCHDTGTYDTSDASFPAFAKPAGYASRVYHRHFIAWGAYCLECHYEHGSNTPHMIRAGSYVHQPNGGSWNDFSMCTINCHGGSPPYEAPKVYVNDY